MLKDSDKKKLNQMLGELPNDVTLVIFTREDCEYCKISLKLLEEIAGVNPKIKLEVHDAEKEKSLADKYRVDKLPAMIMRGARDYNIRFFGVPSGYELVTLLQDISDVSRNDPKLPPEVVAKLKELTKPVHIEVLVTPTCPFCPAAVRVAHRFAMITDLVTADMIEVSEFDDISVKYNVRGVPQTVINESISLVGAHPEKTVLEKIFVAIRPVPWWKKLWRLLRKRRKARPADR
ncbi:MAG: glutaredoxin [Verrucomicrobia bacterium]|nr:glutaredoxin [Verrucomicrobiota bacterium]